MYTLVDGNDLPVSCERFFGTSLNNGPLVEQSGQ